jgi:hypothetical protein
MGDQPDEAALLNEKADQDAKDRMLKSKQDYRKLSGSPLW